ncbi:OmpH family outer membrane protein [Sphingomonas sp. ID0503]|uniref:OmpH family outer membrane protein n=1 Tax=Sphingomonas sp. ID0503 TaxID=3399691 RepID=UPI003AFA35B0
MKNILTIAALAASAAALPTVAVAQSAPNAVIVTVDTQRIYAECTACKAAQAQLQSQAQALQALAQQLQTPLQTEAEGLRTALAGKTPETADAATKARITAFQTKQQQAQQQLQQREQSVQRNRAYVLEQINNRLNPIVTQVMQARKANLAIDTQATLAAASSIDATNDVLAQLNSQLPSVATTAPAAAAAPAGQPSR